MAVASSQNGIDAHDAAGVSANAAQLVADGYTFVAQYIDQNDTNEDSASPNFDQSADGPAGGSLTPAQAAADLAAGLKIVSIFETNGEAVSPYEGVTNSDAKIVQYLTTNQGAEDGAEAVASAKTLGQATGTGIYFALDFDPGPGDYTPGAKVAVENYLKGVSQALAGSGYKVGVYGAAQTLQWATSQDTANSYSPSVSYTWLSGSTGWAGYDTISGPGGDSSTHGWTMIQRIPGDGNSDPATAPGTTVAIDGDRTAAGADFGAWASTLCFCAGTRIATPGGEVPVEDISIGDLVVTAAGVHRPVKWIGRRSYVGRFVNGNPEALPICFAAGSLGEGLPRRDLFVSPGHAMLVEDQLIHAQLLVNGVTITQAKAVESITYFNLELNDHDVVLAEGAPAESFYDNGLRNAFANAAEFARLYPDDPGPGLPYQPLLEQGFVLEGIRRRIDARAGIVRPTLTVPGTLRGFLDVAGPEVVAGWAQDEAHPEEPVRLDVLVDDRRVMRVLANKDRADLRRVGLGSGRHAFEVALPAGCHGAVTVQRAADGVPLPLTCLAREALAA